MRALVNLSDPERQVLAEFLNRVDSVCSLVAHRGLDVESTADLLALSHEARYAAVSLERQTDQ